MLPVPAQRLPANPVASIAALPAVSRAIHRRTEEAVAQMRVAGLSWADIGRELGITRQGASQRWRYVDELLGAAEVVIYDRGTCDARPALRREFRGGWVEVDSQLIAALDDRRRLALEAARPPAIAL
jgi:hypothetical protein